MQIPDQRQNWQRQLIRKRSRKRQLRLPKVRHGAGVSSYPLETGDGDQAGNYLWSRGWVSIDAKDERMTVKEY